MALILTGNSSSLTVDSTSGITFPNATIQAVAAQTGPSFSAYLSATQSLTANTWTKIQCNVEEWDTASCYDNATNFRFTPNVAGYYQVSGMYTNATIATGAAASVYKNNAQYKRLFSTNATANTSSAGGSCLVYLNGSTDYIELWALTNSTQNAYADSAGTYFQAALIRVA